VQVVDRDWLVRQYAFKFLEDLTERHPEALPWKALQSGFGFEGERVTLIGQRGIWKPRALELPISITTSWKDPYGDLVGEDGLLQYRYFGTDPSRRTVADVPDQRRPGITHVHGGV
jgi:putative restriction endonuclease